MSTPKKSFSSPRATNRNWTLTYGLVQVPIALTSMWSKDNHIEQNNLCPEHLTPVGYGKMVCKEAEHEVEEPLKGFQYEKGKWVVLDPSEETALPLEHDGIIKLKACLPVGNIDPALFEGSYIATPQHDGALVGFSLLCGYARSEERAFVGVGTWYGTTKTFVLRWDPDKNILAAHTCAYYANLKQDDIDKAAAIPIPDRPVEEIALAESVFSRMDTTFDWYSVVDQVAEQKRLIIAEKLATGAVTITPKFGEPVEVPDITEALKAMMAERNSVTV